ncbi:K(+)-transporting ATPase subunit C [Brevundimonas sp.]|uniref:K(+)-transporting ATPase subunit C n=1 Tax=Brevundimonas sp. TaxID=1871086 RepID=UPI001AC5A4BD|nr:K(+)-transporting ATPase subunit C [Brevundimonas sp.]MBN9466305.1 K(+)-transporting ATPase subunit C [Brevundimonas sp.]
MLNQARPAIVMIGLFTVVLGLGYPLAVTGVAQTVFPDQANGSLVRDGDGAVRGSALIGQSFTGTTYLHPRPSAAGDGYDGSSSSGSNMGPLNEDLKARVAETAAAIRAEDGSGVIPADAVTASGSGLDPDISPAYARLQTARIARARGVTVQQVQSIIDANTEQPFLGFIGQPHVNVLLANRDLDARLPAS